MGSESGQVIAEGAFQIFDAELTAAMNELLSDIFGRPDIAAMGADWRGIIYFSLHADPEFGPEVVLGFDPSSGSSGPLATVDEVMVAVADGSIGVAVDAESFDAWRAGTGADPLAMGECVPPALLEFLGGDPAERATEPAALVTHVALGAALMGRIEALGVAPGEEIPPEVFDDDRWA